MNINALRGFQRYLRKHLREYRIRRQIPDSEWRLILEKEDIPLEKVTLKSNKKLELAFEKNKVIFPKSTAAFRVLSAYPLMRELEANTDCRLAWGDAKNALVMGWGNACYLADNAEEIYILHEIFFTGDYDFSPGSPTVLVDVGANVGFTSLFLASANPDLFIIGCEPLEVNYRKALRNFSENPDLARRITLRNYGLFSDDGAQTIISEFANRGRSSIVIDRQNKKIRETEKVQVKVRKASIFFREVRDQYPESRIIVKMDCEGSEYAILESLLRDNMLEQIDGFLMEWHRLAPDKKDATYIRGLLTGANFDVCVRGRLQTKKDAGMVYAFRRDRLSGKTT